MTGKIRFVAALAAVLMASQPAFAATDVTIVTVVKVTGINWFNRMDDGVKEFAKDNPGVKAYQTAKKLYSWADGAIRRFRQRFPGSL